MKRSLLIYIIGIGGFGLAAAQPADSTLAGRVVEHEDAVVRLCDGVYANPAMQHHHYATSLNTLRLGWQHRSSSSPERLEEGSGMNRGFANIDAYLHKGKGTIYGSAAYSNGTAHDLQYCETADFETVYPYVMADTVGGCSKRERYFFRGGFSWPVGRFLIGAEGQYAALMEYRTRDPRPKNVSGDLRAKVGAAYRFSSGYLLGAALTAGKYKQTNELEIYNEVQMPTVYHLTGLGNDYYRFRGDYMDTYYKGYNVGGMLTFSHKDNRGLFAHMAYSYGNMDKIISSLNQLPMTTLDRYEMDGALGYTGTCGRDAYGVSLDGRWQQRNGTENIFGSAQDNIYPQIAKAEQFSLTAWQTSLRATWQRNAAHSGLAATVAAAWSGYKERYDEPRRQLKANAFTPSLTLDGHAAMGKVLLTAQAAMAYSWTSGNELTLPDGLASSALLTPTLSHYDYLSSNRLATRMNIEAGYNAGRLMPFIRLDWHYAHYKQHEHANRLELAAGIRF